jgi:hypothetical protein
MRFFFLQQLSKENASNWNADELLNSTTTRKNLSILKLEKNLFAYSDYTQNKLYPLKISLKSILNSKKR